MPRVFEKQQQKGAESLKITPGAPCVVSEKDFKRNFSIFTEDQLKFLNWDNIFIAGGSVLACLSPIPEPHNKSKEL
jgi:hypothetical protein